MQNNLQDILDNEAISVVDLAKEAQVNLNYVIRLCEHDGHIGARTRAKVLKALRRLSGHPYTKKDVFPKS